MFRTLFTGVVGCEVPEDGFWSRLVVLTAGRASGFLPEGVVAGRGVCWEDMATAIKGSGKVGSQCVKQV